MEIRGKNALVTGAAKRIGKEIALALAQKGANVLLHYHTSKAEAEKTAGQIRSLGRRCDLFEADLSKTQEILRMTRQIAAGGLSVDILVQSASLFYETPLTNVKESDWNRLLDTNLKGPFFLSLELGKKMADGKGGQIVHIADRSGLQPYKDYAPYCASKGGLIALTKALARDLAPKVRCNAVAPGPILAPPDMSEEEKESIAQATALGRWGSAADVAHAVLFLTDNDFMNGTVLVVDGGRSLF